MRRPLIEVQWGTYDARRMHSYSPSEKDGTGKENGEHITHAERLNEGNPHLDSAVQPKSATTTILVVIYINAGWNE